ncbi:MAG: diacylglycerol kinase family lipid kinase [Ignavibacteriae bacterium]|nr:diacylglycerol kinase family lipid kinase [Ignavibacteriota bacterium]
MANSKRWFAIINPTSGNGSSKKKWPQIENLLNTYNFDFDYAFTEHENHSPELIQQAIERGFLNIICVGGDGTLHNIVNGIMNQSKVPSNEVTIGMIPIGTGNDWVKTHNIPNDFEKVIQLIKNGNIKTQDLGKIEFINEDRKPIYFNNLAGVGFDGFVVSKVHKYKHFGAIAYLVGAAMGLFSFKNFKSNTVVDAKEFNSKTLMVLVGLCNYSGGGMQLTKEANPFDGLFDISIAKNIGKLDIIRNLTKLFNGKIVNHKKVETLKSDSISITIDEDELPFIQADGELIGKGNIVVYIVPKAFSFYGN